MESGIVVLTNFGKKEKQVERLGGQFPRGAYLTPATFRALKEGIESGEIVKRIERYNEKYKNAVKDLEANEAKTAEMEVAKSAEQAKVEVKAKVDAKTVETKVVENAQSANNINIDAVKAKIAQLNIRIQRLTGNFGTLGDNFGVNVIPDSPARPLKIPRVNFETLCVLRNIDFSDVGSTNSSQQAQQPVTTAVESKESAKTANWKQLFDELIEQARAEEKTKPIQVERKDDDEDVEVDMSGEVTETELKRRALIGQTGEELEKIRDLRRNLNEYDSPFGLGLVEREQNLLNILVNAADIEDSEKIKPIEIDENAEETEFQKIVNSAVGYIKPLTAEEEKAKVEEMNDYYSDPETLADIDKQLMKDRLYMMNNPEMSMKIDEAEREADRRVAQQAISSSQAIEDAYNLRQGAKEQALELMEFKKVFDGAKKQAQELFEKERVVKGAKSQAKELLEKRALLEGSMKQAEEIIEKYLAVMGAKAQAKAILEREKISSGAKEQARQLFDKKVIMDGAKEQARQLCYKKNLIDGAREQARELIEKDIVLNGAKEQAKNLNERNKIVKGARTQAIELIERQAIINGAYDQAKSIINSEKVEKETSKKSKSIDLIEGSKTQALELSERKKVLDGAKKQAEELNEKTIVVRGAKKQAKNLVEKNKLLNGAKSQAEELNERTIVVRGAKGQAKNLVEKNNLLNGAKSQAEELNERNIVIRGAKKQAKELAEKSTLLGGAKEQAILLLRNLRKNHNMMTPSDMEDIVIKMNNNSLLIDGAKEQAEILFSKMNKNKKINKRLEGLNCTFTEINDRYGDVVGNPRPLKINKDQYQALVKFSNDQDSSDEDGKSLEDFRDSLAIPNVEFLKIA